MLKAALAASAAFAVVIAGAARADTPVVIDSGWQTDIVGAADTPSDGSPLTFTLAGSALFSLSDCCVAGDIWTVKVNGGSSFSSAFTLLPTPFDNNAGPWASTFAPLWLDAGWSHLQLKLGAGAYSLSVSGDGDGGLPASFGYRLDSGVPEPATWAMMLIGFGGLGAVLRSRRQALAAA